MPTPKEDLKKGKATARVMDPRIHVNTHSSSTILMSGRQPANRRSSDASFNERLEALERSQAQS